MTLLQAYALVACIFALCLRDIGPRGALVPTVWTYVCAALWPALAACVLVAAAWGVFEGMMDRALREDEE